MKQRMTINVIKQSRALQRRDPLPWLVNLEFTISSCGCCRNHSTIRWCREFHHSIQSTVFRGTRFLQATCFHDRFEKPMADDTGTIHLYSCLPYPVTTTVDSMRQSLSQPEWKSGSVSHRKLIISHWLAVGCKAAQGPTIQESRYLYKFTTVHSIVSPSTINIHNVVFNDNLSSYRGEENGVCGSSLCTRAVQSIWRPQIRGLCCPMLTC